MLRYWLEKVWVQNTVLAVLGIISLYYWGWVFDFGYDFQWPILFTVNDTYQLNFGVEILNGLWLTVKITLISSLIGITLGTALGLARLSDFKPLNWTATCVVEFFRNTPLLVILFFFYFAFPQALPEAGRELLFETQFEFWTATFAVGIYTSAFMAAKNVRINAISAGPIKTLAASGIGGFRKILNYIEENAPMQRNVTIQDVGKNALYLASDLSAGVTGEVLHVDCGYHTVGIGIRNEDKK